MKKTESFFIGLTGGLIAILFPKISKYLASPNTETVWDTFNPQFLLVVVVASVLVGLATYWIHKGSEEKTNNVFMAALALPAVLSGGFQTTAATIDGNQREAIVEANASVREGALSKEMQRLQKMVRDRLNIREVEGEREPTKIIEQHSVFSLDSALKGSLDPAVNGIGIESPLSSYSLPANTVAPGSLGNLWHLLGPDEAMAMGPPSKPVEEPTYVPVLGKANNKEALIQLGIAEFGGYSARNTLRVIETEKGFYLIKGEAKPMNDALESALDIRNELPQADINLLRMD